MLAGATRDDAGLGRMRESICATEALGEFEIHDARRRAPATTQASSGHMHMDARFTGAMRHDAGLGRRERGLGDMPATCDDALGQRT